MTQSLRRFLATGATAALLVTASGATPGATRAEELASNLPLRDNLEAGLGKWERFTDGSGRIGTTLGYAGTRGMRIVSPGETGDRAYVRYTLTRPEMGLLAAARFRVISARCDPNGGWSKGNVPFFRLFDTEGNRVVGLYRIKAPCTTLGRLYVQHSYDNYFPTSRSIALLDWNRLELRATVTTPGRSLVQVYLNGTSIYRSVVASNGALPFGAIQLGNEHLGQASDLVVDDVYLARLYAPPAAANPCTPETPEPSPLVASGASTLVADGFESYTLDTWAVRLGGNGSVAVRSGYATDGTCSARFLSSTTLGSRALLLRRLPSGTTRVMAEGSFRVARDGGSTMSGIPYFRIRTGTTRIVDVYRQNVTGALWLAWRDPSVSDGYRRIPLHVSAPLGSSRHIAVEADAATRVLRVWIDGTKVAARIAPLPSRFTEVFLGQDALRQVVDLWADSIIVTTGR